MLPLILRDVARHITRSLDQFSRSPESGERENWSSSIDYITRCCPSYYEMLPVILRVLPVILRRIARHITRYCPSYCDVLPVILRRVARHITRILLIILRHITRSIAYRYFFNACAVRLVWHVVFSLCLLVSQCCLSSKTLVGNCSYLPEDLCAIS